MIEFTPVTLGVYGLLTVAILSVWYKRPLIINTVTVPLWLLFLFMSLLAGLLNNVLDAGAFIYLFSLMACCYIVKSAKVHIAARFIFAFLVVLMVVALFLHKVPFFNNSLVFDQYYKSPGSAVYSKYWNYDKAAAGLILVAFFGDICASAKEFLWKAKIVMPISIATIFISIALAVLLGYMQFDVTFTAAYFAWAWANLFFTCVAEEMLFRGFVQKNMLKLANNEAARIAVVVFVGMLFGLAHFAGGVTYVALAAIAGIGYGLTYYKTGKIEFAILTHFLLNSVHFVFFSYPFIRVGV